MGGFDRVLEICASTRVLRERRLRALDESPERALLGRDFVTFRGFAERCAAETGVPVRALLAGAAFTELVALCARGRGELGERLADRPGLAPALAATLRDLRDAGVTPEDLPRSYRDLAATHSALDRALAKLEKDGVFDRVGLFRLAQRGAKEHLARRGYAAVEVRGATELVGSVGDLLQAASESLPLRFFQPDFASPYVERLDGEWPWSFRPEPTELLERPALARDGEIPADALLVRRARSPRAELEGVEREVLSLIERGVAPSHIQVVARTLEPYAPWLDSVFTGFGIPFTSSLRVPALASPAQRAWLDLVQAVTRDLERAPVVRVAQSLALGADPGVAALAERVARKRAVVRGEADWSAALADEKSPSLGGFERILAALARGARALAGAKRFADAASCVRELGAELFGATAVAQVDESLASLALFDSIRAAAGPSSETHPADFRHALESVLLEPTSTPFAEDRGGVRVLDAVQARAVPCSHLFLLGMNHGSWPRALPEDPFLPDAVRAELRGRLRRPVPVRGAVADEDRFLLGLLLSQASDRVVLSFSESDSSGRAQSPSSLLRTLPFVEAGTDVLAKEPVPWESVEPRYLRAAQALELAARSPEAETIADRLEAGAWTTLRAGLALVRATDALTAESLAYDGEVGDALAPPETLSPSQLEALGRCPLRALFDGFLRADPLEPRSADELEANEAGVLVHDALEWIYRKLSDEGLLARGGSPAKAIAHARELLDTALDETQTKQRPRVRERHATAWRAFRGTIQRALDDFLVRDLERLLPGGVEKLETEQKIRADLAIGGESLAVQGKIDRIAWLADGNVRVGDYKTSRQFDAPVKESRIRKGLSLQVPLYTRMVAARDGIDESLYGEALTVPLRPERDRDRERDDERTVSAADLSRWSEKALVVLAGLLRDGVFPLANDEREACRYCRYKVACRVQHPPSAGRVWASDSMQGYLALEKEKAR